MAAALGPFLDGELSPDKVIEVEQHLTSCPGCTEWVRFHEAIRWSTRDAVTDVAIVSPAFEQRVRAALTEEKSRPPEVVAAPPLVSSELGRSLSWRSVAPLALAASVVLAIGAWNADKSPARTSSVTEKTASAASSQDPAAALESLIDALVDDHATPTPPAVTEPQLIGRFEPEVGVPVRVPGLHQYGARLEGGNVIVVRNQRAASLRYRLGGRRVTVYVYDASRVPIRAHLEPRVLRNTAVFVGRHRGYSIAAVEKRGVGHAVATDLDDNESAELVVASFRP